MPIGNTKVDEGFLKSYQNTANARAFGYILIYSQHLIANIIWGLYYFLYINDLPNINKILNFYLFADDTNIYHESNSLNDLERTVNKELNKLYLWLNLNRLSLNIDKTNFIIFHPYNKPVTASNHQNQ